jgi:hypothetical protein
MPIYPFLTNDSNRYLYGGVTAFWQQKEKVNTNETGIGWVAIVVNGSNYTGNVLTDVMDAYQSTYTYLGVKSEISTKNRTYLYAMGSCLKKIPSEAMTS